jgi:hypothetical protein
MKTFTSLLFILIFKSAASQLLPSIGLNSLPANSATICDAPWYLGSFYSSGIAAGSTAPDFKLYSVSGDSLVLSSELQSAKPVLLIGGSLTCPVFRNKVAVINKVVSAYGSSIKVFVIYTLEAHPTDTSVYFGYVNVTSQNSSSGILFPQPVTYGERKQMADTMNSWVTLNAPVYIDGPCNEWWSTFGPAPNNAYLIDPGGKILLKHGWFDKSPDKIFCDLDSILGVTSGYCVNTTAPGNFKINVLNTTANGSPGSILYNYIDVINTGSVDVTVLAQNIQRSYPINWQTGYCADICYTAGTDSIVFTVPPLDTIKFTLDFYTSANPDTGSVKLGFKNVNKNSNSFSGWFRASTVPNLTSLGDYTPVTGVQLVPNPACDQIFIAAPGTFIDVSVNDEYGRELIITDNVHVRTAALNRGIYFARIRTTGGIYFSRFVISR